MQPITGSLLLWLLSSQGHLSLLMTVYEKHILAFHGPDSTVHAWWLSVIEYKCYNNHETTIMKLWCKHGGAKHVQRIVLSSHGARVYNNMFFRADCRLSHNQWETALLCSDVSHWLGASPESALFLFFLIQESISVLNIGNSELHKVSCKCCTH